MVDDWRMGSVEGAVTRSRTLLVRVWGRMLRRSDGRAPLWIELAVIGWLFYLYDEVNNLAPLRQQLAVHNAVGLIGFEHSLHLSPELAINTWLSVHATVGSIASYYYFFAHGLVTFAVLALMWWKRPALYRRQRSLLVIINLVAFAVFWRYPLAPPRMFPKLGYTDVIATSHALVSWSSGALVHDADQLAAMPSLHIAWAIWSGLSLWLLARRRIVALAAIAYPLMTALVVMGTGNHYVLDVVAGAATVPLAFALARGFDWLMARARRLSGEAVAVPARGVRFEPGVLVAAVVPGGSDGESVIAAEEPRSPRRRASAAPRRGVRESA